MPRATLAAVARPRCPAGVVSWQGGGAEAPRSVRGAGGETLGLGCPFSRMRPANAHACLLRNSRLGCLLVGPAAPSLPAPGTGQAANPPQRAHSPSRSCSAPMWLPRLRAAPSLEAVWVFAAWPTHGTGTGVARQCRTGGRWGDSRLPWELRGAKEGQPGCRLKPYFLPVSCQIPAKALGGDGDGAGGRVAGVRGGGTGRGSARAGMRPRRGTGTTPANLSRGCTSSPQS